ncbi:MAG: xseA, partial [Acidimicrobiaceae bacterium]|nr:xseA [Acidimicrobiaceae bacterium]
MSATGASEELRLFEVSEPPPGDGMAGRQARRKPRALAAEEAAEALRRRVEEVSAIAHSSAPPGSRRTRREDGPERDAEEHGAEEHGAAAATSSVAPEILDGQRDRSERGGERESGVESAAAQAARTAHAPGERTQLEGRTESTPWSGEPAWDDFEVEGDDDAPVEAEESLTVAAFYDRVRSALNRAFPTEVWVTGEIRGLRESRGHRYLELADHGAPTTGRGGGQQLEVVCWAREWPPVAAALAEAGVDLEVGRVVRVRGRVSVWEGGAKLRFTLTAVDVEALLGGIAAARRRLLQALAAEDLLEANHRLPLPLVPLRVGVVTSPGSEAHRDFVGQLERSGFAFEVHLEPSLVQGPEAPYQVAAALRRMAGFGPDLAVVVRGGGARGDLAAFDSEEVARAIATALFPVWTGIGHTGDRSVADEVANRACITPTACGEAVVGLVCDYTDAIAVRVAALGRVARARLESAEHLLESRRASMARGARHQLDRRADGLRGTGLALGRAVGTELGRERARLGWSQQAASAGAHRLLEREEREHHRCRQVLRAYDPGRQLERG